MRFSAVIGCGIGAELGWIRPLCTILKLDSGRLIAPTAIWFVRRPKDLRFSERADASSAHSSRTSMSIHIQRSNCLMNERVKHLGGLTSTFGKDLAREKRLAALNELLAPVEAELERHYSAPRFPVTFVLGPPRSGTTLTSQLLAQSGLFGIISNFAARFWRAPALGLRI